MKISTDQIVGAGLVLALILSILHGGSNDLQTTLGSGLIGYLGRTVIDSRSSRSDAAQESTTKQEKEVKKPCQ